MDDEIRRKVIETLRRGEELPTEWARELFPPERREYELVYWDKAREEDILADTMAVPLQPVRTFGKNGNNWANMLIFGDNLQAMKMLLRMKEEGHLRNADGSNGIRLIYLDPPFGTKQDFSGSKEQRVYQDKIAGAKFVEFLRKRLVLMKYLLADDGSLYVHLDQRKAHYIKVVLDELLGEANFQNEVVWRNTNSHSKATCYGPIHQTILFYSRNSSPYFKKWKRPPFKEYVEKNFAKAEDGKFYAKADLTADGRRSGESGRKWNGYDPTKQDRHWGIPSFVYELLDDDIGELPLLEKLNYLKKQGWIYMPDKNGGQPRIFKPLDYYVS